MKLSENTVTLLKNFASINPSIHIKEGNMLRTIAPQKTIMASSKINEVFPANAGIYDLPRFLSAFSLFDNPELIFDDNMITMKENKRTIRYVLTDPKMFLNPPENDIDMPPCEIEVDVEYSNLQSVMKAASVLSLPEIAFIGDGSYIYLKAVDSSDPTSDDFGVELEESNKVFRVVFRVENIKLLPNTYKVSLSSKGLANFSSDNTNYFIAIESAHSSFEEVYKNVDKTRT